MNLTSSIKSSISALAFLPLGLLLFTVSVPVASSSEALTCRELGKLAANSPDCQDFGNSNKNPQNSTSVTNKELVMIESDKVSDVVATFYVVWKSIRRQGNNVVYNTQMIAKSLDGKAKLNIVTVNIGDCYTKENSSLGMLDANTGKTIKSGLTPKESLIKGSAAYKALDYVCGQQ